MLNNKVNGNNLTFSLTFNSLKEYKRSIRAESLLRIILLVEPDRYQRRVNGLTNTRVFEKTVDHVHETAAVWHVSVFTPHK